MQFAEEFTAHRLNAYAEAERAREIELRRVIAERKALAKEERATARRARKVGVVAAPEAVAAIVPETVTVEAILRSAPVVVGAPAGDEAAPLVESGAGRELHAAVR
jgi:hypothetical protein